MRVLLSWLRELAPVEQEPDELADVLTSRGLKVEGIDRPWQGLEGVLVARVVEKRPHPNSDRLTLATLDTGGGRGPAHVVAGVANWEVGDLVPYAPPGSRVPVLPEPLSTRELRGEASEGMICSPHELAVSADHGGSTLPGDIAVGADVKAVFGLDETVFDIEIKSNRPDLLSVLGVAREAAAATGVPLSLPDTSVVESDVDASSMVTVRIVDLERCPRYLARVVRGVTVGPSPLRIQARLQAAGMRPVSNVVDGTNYVMLELGQPLHAFDLARVAGPGIVVRRAEEGERIVTLDGVERTQSSEDLVIADLERAIAIAGVMGSSLAEVGDGTSDVLLESACFARTGVIRTSRRLNLRTEASVRFERGTDPEGVPAAASRAAAMIAAWSGGTVARGWAEAGAVPPRRQLIVRPDRASKLLALPETPEDIVESLGLIGIAARAEPDGVYVEVPSWRVDLEREVDLIEDVIRIQGYDRVGATLPPVRQAGDVPATLEVRRRARSVLVRTGLRETKSYSFASPADLALMSDDPARAVPVRNPLSAQDAFLRTSLLPGLLRAVRLNVSRQVRSASLFEVGRVFRLGEGGGAVEEREPVAGVFAGTAGTGLRGERRPFDFFDAKGAVEALMEAFRVASWILEDGVSPADPGPPTPWHPARGAAIAVDGRTVGRLGELHPRIALELDLPAAVAMFEVDLTSVAGTTDGATYRDVARFPPVRRDLAFVVDAAVPVGAIEAAIVSAGGGMAGMVELFDVFEGPPLTDGTKSTAFSVEFRVPDRTLTDAEVSEAVERIAGHVRERLGGELRRG